MTETTVRVFVPTYRRPHLLPRALRSLQAQTHADWVAEVHNDAPDDPAPAEVVRSFGDPRILYVCHERNIGGTALFNLAFGPHPEPFVAVLEDDNWWQASFLERMIGALRANRDITVAWANQAVWEETAGGEWRDTRRFVRPIVTDSAPTRVTWGHPAQCFGGLHAHGTVMIRTHSGHSYPTPPMDLGSVEAVRERAYPHPLLYISEPLGVFGATVTTHRSRDRLVWATHQVLLAASFLKHVHATRGYWEKLWQRARASSPRMTSTLLLATRQDPTLRCHLTHAVPDDWRYLAVRTARRPLVFLQLLRARRRAPAIWDHLDAHTADRAREAATAGPAEHETLPALP